MTHSDGERAGSASNLPEPYAARGLHQGVVPYGDHSGGHHSLPPGLASKPNALTLLKALKRRWLLASSLGIVCAVAAAALAWYFVPPKYSAYAVVRVLTRPSSVLDEEKGGNENLPSIQKSQSAMVKTQQVLSKALTKYKAGDLPLLRDRPNVLEWLEKEVQVDFLLGPEYMRISLSGERPQDLQAVVNAIVQAFLEVSTTDERMQRSNRTNTIDALVQKYQEDMLRQKTAHQKLAEAAGSGNPFVLAVKQEFLQQKLMTAQAELAKIQSELMHARVGLNMDRDAVQGNKEPIVHESVVEQLIKADPVVAMYRQDLLNKEKTYSEMARRMNNPEASPLLDPYRRDINGLKLQIIAQEQRVRPTVIGDLKSKLKGATKDRIAQAQGNIAKLQALEAEVGDTVKKLSDRAQKEISGAIGVDTTKEEMEFTSTTLHKMRDLQTKAAIEKNAPMRASPLEDASIKRAQAQQRQIMFASVAGIGGLALALFFVAYMEFQTRRINTGDDVVYGLGWRLVGALPALPDGRRGLRRNGQDDKYWHSILTESVDATRTMLLHAARTEGLRTVMVTSAVAGEGKTSLSCHLATSLARAGRKTLLIDCDLRSPSAHRLFELPAEPGFSEVLRNHAELASVTHETPAENLWLIPAGKCDALTLQSLAQDAIKPILDQLKEQYEFIIIDSSPVLPVVDALVIGQNVDVVIFSLLRDVSRIPNVYAAYQRLATLGIRMLGAVVNGVHKDAYGASYHYYARQAAN
jgi:succinoglycan biosynthesis transport protein ExoP